MQQQVNLTQRVAQRNTVLALRLELPYGAQRIDGLSLYMKAVGQNMRVPKLYYGVAAAGQSGSAFIATLGSKQADTSIANFTATAGLAQKVYFALPKAYGVAAAYIGKAVGGFASPSTASIVDAETGYTEDYYLYESILANLGAVQVFTE